MVERVFQHTVSGTVKINIVLPYNTWGGAFRSTYELANHMAARGESVEIYIPFFPYLHGVRPVSRAGVSLLIRGLGRSIVRWNRMPWFDLKVPFRIVPVCSDRFIRDADIVVANHWPTAFSVARLSPTKGRKFYIIRDAEKDSRDVQFEEASYQLPLSKIVTTPRLKSHLEDNFGIKVVGMVTNGINMNDFGVNDKLYNEAPVVCMMYVDLPVKGMPDGFEVLMAVKKRHPQVKVILFGWKRPTFLPVPAEFYLRPVKKTLKEIYGGSDIFLCPSLQEGYHNPPREAMAAKCAVVATNVGSIPHCTIPGETTLVVEPGDVDGMVEAICSLIEKPERIRQLGHRGYEHIQQFTWERATSQLLELFTSN